jgi:hypothetical protein
MTTAQQGRIGEQHQSYRKGLVLGLTMAEIAILIIFVLLLLLVFNQLQQARQVEQLGGRDPASLLVRAQAFEKIVGAMGGSLPPDTSPDFDRLVNVAADAVRKPSVGGAVSTANQSLQMIKRAQREITNVASGAKQGGVDSLSSLIEDQAYTIANKQGQIDGLQARLDSAGKGGGALPSCWAQQGGKIDYVYDVILSSKGIRMREYEYGYRLKEQMAITQWVPDPKEIITDLEFTQRTRPWYDYSRHHDCRFFVVVYDETGPNEKALYKALLKTVENHFYKRLDDGRGPF